MVGGVVLAVVFIAGGFSTVRSSRSSANRVRAANHARVGSLVDGGRPPRSTVWPRRLDHRGSLADPAARAPDPGHHHRLHRGHRSPPGIPLLAPRGAGPGARRVRGRPARSAPAHSSPASSRT
ncbi:hypothetical protein QJS66_12245 [Kocuria rhizophila]|nr:hypothetical protein QJS66_12245 [Kocuria rhizophila]